MCYIRQSVSICQTCTYLKLKRRRLYKSALMVVKLHNLPDTVIPVRYHLHLADSSPTPFADSAFGDPADSGSLTTTIWLAMLANIIISSETQ
jgi:hypothetical protein